MNISRSITSKRNLIKKTDKTKLNLDKLHISFLEQNNLLLNKDNSTILQKIKEENNYLTLTEKIKIENKSNNSYYSFIINMINLSSKKEDFRKALRNIIDICEKMLFNELEVCIFSILTEKIINKNQYINFDLLFLTCIGILTKSCSNNNHKEIITKFIYKQNPDLENQYNAFYDTLDKKSIKYTILDVNMKYKQLSRINNIYCKHDVIDYSYIVDRVMMNNTCSTSDSSNNLISIQSSNNNKEFIKYNER